MEWFEVDRAGLARVLERRGKAFLLFELVSNTPRGPGVRGDSPADSRRRVRARQEPVRVPAGRGLGTEPHAGARGARAAGGIGHAEPDHQSRRLRVGTHGAGHRGGLPAARNAGDLGDQSHRLGLITLKHAGRLKKAIAEYREIFLAIEARDPNRAEAAMRKHLRADCDVAVRDAMPAGHTQSRLRARR